MKKNLIVVIIILILILVVGIVILKYNSIEKRTLKSSSEISRLFNGMNVSKYKITNKEELEAFNLLLSPEESKMSDSSKKIPWQLKINERDIQNKTVLIEKRVLGSGSISPFFLGVDLKDNKAEFKIKVNELQGAGTCDMAYWYYLAIIPNSKLKQIDLEDWSSPIDIDAMHNNIKFNE